MFFSAAKVLGEWLPNLWPVLKTCATVERAAKFGDDRQNDFRDWAAKEVEW